MSLADGSPAYGGTPSDESVKRLIKDLKERDLDVVLYPFVMMDVPAGNSLPDPYGGTGQPPYPWRGRITCDPAPGRAGTPDGTTAAATQVERWFTRAAGFNRMVLHYADLAEEAGGVQGFILGSELVGLTRVRSASGVYPAVARLRALAAEVRAILRASTKIVYAADWTEYGAHVLDGGGEVRFPLDPLFADDDIDAVGIDYYPPISDWRDTPNHADLAAARSVNDVDYLRGRLGSGEAFDWYYATSSERNAQTRRPITDGAYGKPWVFRQKDLVSWWSNRHMERVDGVEIGATAWQPQSKPIWLTEIGIPAVDKGPNGPNVFPDPKSSESAYPPFSRGVRDDLVQARGLEAILSRFDPAQRGFAAEYNPASTSYNGRMVDPDNIFVWAWDARPFPAFPDFDIVWSDSANWETGHWITGRIEGATLDRLIVRILRDFGFVDPGPIPVDGFVDGYVIDRPMSVRGALEPLLRLFGVDAVARGGAIAWQGRGGRAILHLTKDDLVLGDKEPSLKLTRAQETELPQQVEVGFTEGDTDYRRAAVASRRLSGASRREARADSAVVTRRAEAQRLADTWLQDLWAGREGAEFELSPRRIELEPGDVIAVPTDAGEKLHRIVRIADGATRKLSTRAVEPAVFERPGSFIPRPVKRPPPVPGKPLAVVLDLPVALGRSRRPAICGGRGGSLAGCHDDLAVRQRRELCALSHPRPARIGRADDDGVHARAALALGSARGARRHLVLRRAELHRRRGGACRAKSVRAAGRRRPLGNVFRRAGRADRRAQLSPLAMPARPCGLGASGRTHGARRGVAGQARRGRRTSDNEPAGSRPDLALPDRSLRSRPRGCVRHGDRRDGAARGAAAVCSRAGRGKARGGGHPPRMDPPHAP